MRKLPKEITKDVLRQIKIDALKHCAKNLYGSKTSPATIAHLDAAAEQFLEWPYDNVAHPNQEIDVAFLEKKYPSIFRKDLKESDKHPLLLSIASKIFWLGGDPDKHRIEAMIAFEKRQRFNFILLSEGKIPQEHQWYMKPYKYFTGMAWLLVAFVIPFVAANVFGKTEFSQKYLKGTIFERKNPPFGTRPWDKMVKDADGNWVLKQ